MALDYPLGDYRAPMDETTLLKKFDAQVLPITGQTKPDRIVEAIINMDKENNVVYFILTNI